jgi:hypothetical protein
MSPDEEVSIKTVVQLIAETKLIIARSVETIRRTKEKIAGTAVSSLGKRPDPKQISFIDCLILSRQHPLPLVPRFFRQHLGFKLVHS